MLERLLREGELDELRVVAAEEEEGSKRKVKTIIRFKPMRNRTKHSHCFWFIGEERGQGVVVS